MPERRKCLSWRLRANSYNREQVRMADWLSQSIFVLLITTSLSWSNFPECSQSQNEKQSVCREILNSTHTFGQILDTEFAIDNNEIEGTISFLSTVDPPIPDDCVDLFIHLACIIALPPCGPDSGLPVLICEDHCQLHKQILQAGLCAELDSHIELVRSVTNSQTFNAAAKSYFEFDCSDPATYYFRNVSNPEPSFCSRLFTLDIIEGVACRLGIGSNCSPSTDESCQNCSSSEGSVLLKAVLPPVVLVLSAAIIFITFFLLCCYTRRRRRKMQPEKCFEMEGKGLSTIERYVKPPTQQNNKISEQNKTTFHEIIIQFSSLTMGKVIGQGAYGKVFDGKLLLPGHSNGRNVAIKTIKNLTHSNLENFLSEAIVMKDFSHPNVLGLVGVVFDTPDGTPHLVLPFMENGNLKTFLKSKRESLSTVDCLPKDLKLSDLVKMCIDVAQGMEYLADKMFVHRDLAARNCMLDKDFQVKVGDFGLSRDIYTTDYYRTSDKSANLPVKWLPPETFNDGISNEKTDIWAFGVTCWEVFSLGRTPYPTVPNSEIYAYISEGQRLERQALCPEEIYAVMSQCWEQKPERRPNFVEVVQTLTEYWEDKFAYF